MSNRKKADKQIASFEAFQEIFVESEKVMRKNLATLVQGRLKKETNFDARMAYKIAIKIINGATLADIDALNKEDLEKEKETVE